MYNVCGSVCESVCESCIVEFEKHLTVWVCKDQKKQQKVEKRKDKNKKLTLTEMCVCFFKINIKHVCIVYSTGTRVPQLINFQFSAQELFDNLAHQCFVVS